MADLKMNWAKKEQEKRRQFLGEKGELQDSQGKESILFDALTQFMKKSALHTANEIVRYYRINAQRYNNPHDIIGHYAAGARLIGLTERQIRRDIDNLTKLSTDNKSPYAKPLVTNLNSFFEKPKRKKAATAKRTLPGRLKKPALDAPSFPGRLTSIDEGTQVLDISRVIPDIPQHLKRDTVPGKIRLRFFTFPRANDEYMPPKQGRKDSMDVQFLNLQRKINRTIDETRKKSIMKPNRISLSLKTTKTQLPSLRPGDIKQKGKTHAARAKTSSSDLTFEDMENIRKQVSARGNNYYTEEE